MNNRIGIVGGGQLGRMLGFAAKQLGFYVTVLDPTPESPAGQVVDRQILAHYTDENAIRELAKTSDYLTFEIELASAAILDEIASMGVMVNPSAKTLSLIKDKYNQKLFLKKNGMPVADFILVQNEVDLKKASKKFGYPFLVKARFDGYDGRGNSVIHNDNERKSVFIDRVSSLLYAEKFIPFKKELAVMVARDSKGTILPYPAVETVHKNNICHIVYAPARVKKSIQKKAQEMAVHVMDYLKGSGVFGIEMFLTKDDDVIINEIAPRVHNSGHYTIEACVTDQFEQHIRAITGLSLGDTSLKVPAAVMMNILGTTTYAGELSYSPKVNGLEKALTLKNASIHLYGKKENIAERKMGHITVIDKTLDQAYNKAVKARKYLKI